MGFFQWIGDKIGGPETVCKSLYKSYKTAIDLGQTHDQALYYCLKTRYSILKTIKEEQFLPILLECKDLGSLAYVCIIKENPLLGGDDIFYQTMEKIINFFDKYDPSQADGLSHFIVTLGKYMEAVEQLNKEEAKNIVLRLLADNSVLKLMLFDNFKYMNNELEKKNSDWNEVSSFVLLFEKKLEDHYSSILKRLKSV